MHKRCLFSDLSVNRGRLCVNYLGVLLYTAVSESLNLLHGHYLVYHFVSFIAVQRTLKIR